MDTSENNNQKTESFFESGLIIDERFEIIEPIRKTSGCIVYRAVDLKQGTDKALLMIPAVIQSDFEAMGILKESARGLKWLNHIYIATFYDLHTRGVHNYFEMEFVPGKSIKRKKYESRDKKFTENMARWVALQVLEGLAHAHEKDLLHKNIKPQKIIFTGAGQVRLIDFGVSGSLRNAMALVRDTTSRSAILFMPPEQLRGKQLSFASDIYSLGATLYYLLNGKPPFNHGDIHYQILNENPDAIEGVSDDLNRIILKCLSKDISQRYETCEDMIKDIRNISQSSKQEPIKPPIPEQKPLLTEKVKEVEKPITRPLAEEEPFGNRNSIFTIFAEKIQMNKSILIWISLFFITVLSVISYKVIFTDSDENRSARNLENSSEDTETNLRMIAALNTAADKQYAKGRYIAPKGNNALELYLEVLKIDSKEEHAIKQIESMKNKLYNDIKRYLNDWMLIEAQELLESCLDYFDDEKKFDELDEELSELLKRSDSLPIQIEILNGAGRSGIAKTLSRFLKENKYKVVNSANYRVNGMVNWQVKKTYFIGSLPKNDRIEKLEELLNLKYKREKLPRKQFKSANILVILGGNYRNIPVLKR